MEPTELFAIASAIFLFALFSRWAEQKFITAPMAFVLFGLIMGPVGFGLLNLPYRSGFVNSLAELTLALILFTDASTINLRNLDKQHHLPLRLLGAGLPLSIAAGLGIGILLFPEAGVWEALALAVILAPTDAALGQAVVSNKRVPQRIRQALNVESGLNDGLAFPALLVAVSLASSEVATKETSEWFVFVAKQVVLGPVAGIAVGYAGSTLVQYCHQRQWMNEVFLQISVLALALLAFTGAELVGGNGFIAAFAAGLTVGTRSKVLRGPLEDFGEAEGQLLTLIVFLLFGLILVPMAISGFSWRHLLYAILSLTVVRLVPVTASLAGTKIRPVTYLFIGWFGPRGLASILYLILVTEKGGIPLADDIFTTVITTIFLSVILHGVTAAPVANAYGGYMERVERANKTEEHRKVTPL